jgi:ATP-binding cassette, subfamily B (MDR/TAP), member 1
MRFYEPTAGDIFVDGTSISELDINWLRNNITLVQQQSILFNETIFRNISFGRRDHVGVTKEQVRVCVDLAQLQSTIEELPKGLDTEVGSGGSALSGGQKQRIALARARLRNTPILILDESTSALDYASRKAVMEAIRVWRRGKTTIIITHDISQIKEEDFVYALDDGHIVEDGYRHALASLDSLASESEVQPSTAVRSGHKPPSKRYSNIAFSTRRSIMRQDSIEMHLDKIPETPRTPMPSSLGANENRRQSVARKRLSAANILATSRRQMMNQATPRSSMYHATLNEAESRNMYAATSRTVNFHSALFQSARPMSMHQAMTLNSIYGNAILPTSRRGSIVVPPLIRPPPGSAGTFVTLSDIMKLSGKEVDTTTRPDKVDSIRSILQTVWPRLSLWKRGQLILGFVAALVHAAGPPVFSYIFSQLLGTFFIKEGQARKALIYSMAILGIAIIDAISDGSMHYLLEGCGQAWVDRLQIQAFERILDQPKAWFDEEENSLAKLTSCLDRNAEEMRNLVGRFAPFIVVVVAMMTIATSWSLVICWKLTLVGIAAAPSLYLVTKGFEAVSSKWENLTNQAGNEAGSIFVETLTDIRTVRALTLESYFHQKYSQATSQALRVGIKRAAYSGFFYGASDSAIHFVTALVFW